MATLTLTHSQPVLRTLDHGDMRSNRTKDQSQARTLRPGAPNSLQPLASKHSSVHSSSSVDVAPLMTASASRADSRSYQDWEDVDKVNEHDPQACSSYARSVFSHLRDAELEKRSRTDYMEVKQGEMNPKMRAILVEWLVEVSEEYKLCADTLYQAVNYLDRFLSVHTVKRPQLQLVGVACLWVASKYEEIYPPTLPDFCYITDNTYSREQLISMEEVILKRLNYQLTVPTAKTFLRRLLQVCNPDEYLHFLSNYLTELSLLDYNMLSFTPSVIAAAGVYLANLMLGRAPWDAQLRHYSAYVPSDIKNGVIALAAVHQAIASSSSLTAVREKYANARFLSVSQMPSIVVTASMFGPN